jgi:hypothetical protein
MEKVDLKDLLSLSFERSSAMQVLWSIYITGALAMIALFGSLKPSRKLKLLALALTLGFGIFAVVNAYALCVVRDQREALFTLVRSLKFGNPSDLSAAKALISVLEVPSRAGVLSLHIGADLLVFVSVWFLALRIHE